MDGIGGRFWQQLRADQLVDRLAPVARARGIRQVISDQREGFALEGLFAKQNLAFKVYDWTNATKILAVERLRRLFADRLIILPQHDKLKQELSRFEEKILPSGAITFAGRGLVTTSWLSC